MSSILNEVEAWWENFGNFIVKNSTGFAQILWIIFGLYYIYSENDLNFLSLHSLLYFLVGTPLSMFVFGIGIVASTVAAASIIAAVFGSLRGSFHSGLLIAISVLIYIFCAYIIFVSSYDVINWAKDL